MKLKQIENYEWDIKFWAAENFGWLPEQVDNMNPNELNKLIEKWNTEQKKEARKNKMNNMRSRFNKR